MRIEVHSKNADCVKGDITEIYEVYNVYNRISGGAYMITFRSFEGYSIIARKDVSNECDIKQCDNVYERVREWLLEHEYMSLVDMGSGNLLSGWSICTICYK